jgi:3',5'-cyclic-nucleotide phosphodiesterase
LDDAVGVISSLTPSGGISYLLKTADTHWEDGIVAVEAGSGIGALRTILSSTRDAFHDLRPVPGIPESPELLAARIYSYIQYVGYS